MIQPQNGRKIHTSNGETTRSLFHLFKPNFKNTIKTLAQNQAPSVNKTRASVTHIRGWDKR
jgi:hypothetical protein